MMLIFIIFIIATTSLLDTIETSKIKKKSINQSIIFYLLIFDFLAPAVDVDIIKNKNELRFVEEPTDTYLTKSIPAVLKCKIENARTGFFKCNNQWSQDQTNTKTIQVNY